MGWNLDKSTYVIICTGFPIPCEVKYDILVKKSINNRFKQFGSDDDNEIGDNYKKLRTLFKHFATSRRKKTFKMQETLDMQITYQKYKYNIRNLISYDPFVKLIQNTLCCHKNKHFYDNK